MPCSDLFPFSLYIVVICRFVLADGQPSPALVAIKDQYNAGAVVAGTSAGIECMPPTITIRSEYTIPFMTL